MIGCFAVVLLHSNGAFWNFSKTIDWARTNIIECVFYFAVPVFFMISGANLIDYNKKYDTKTYAKKRLIRVFLPFVFWSFISIIFAFIMGNESFGNFSFKSFLNAFMNSKYIGVFWFFIPLFSVYLCIPLFAHIPDDKKQKTFLYVIIIGLVFNVLLPFIFSLLKLDYNNGLKIGVCLDYILFTLIGYYIDHYNLPKKVRIVVYILGVLGLFAHLFGTIFASYSAGHIVNLYKGYTNLPSVLYSTAIFLFFKNISNTKFIDFCYKIFKPFSNCTFGVYLTHFFILQLFCTIPGIDPMRLYFRVGIGIATFIISICLVKAITLIPKVKKIVGS